MNSIEFIHNIAKRREPDKFDWEQAKEMHEKEMVDACHKMQIINDVDFDGNVTFMFSPEDYYKETYKK
jgi:hypothetical protein